MVRRTKVPCPDCGHMFRDTYSLKVHKNSRKHSAAQAPTLICHSCKKHFGTKHSLKRHIFKFHVVDSAQGTMVRGRGRFKCPLCPVSQSKIRLNDHFTQEHRIKLEYQTKRFDSVEDFLSWKTKFENETVSRFVCYATFSQQGGFCKRTYNCQRSGRPNIKSADNRVYKVRYGGSNKLNGFCPASITLQMNDKGDFVEALICTTHVGHRNELGRLHLSREDRFWLASKIADGVPFDDILEEIRDTLPLSTNLRRLHLTTRKDLHNIVKQFNLTGHVLLKGSKRDSVPAMLDNDESDWFGSTGSIIFRDSDVDEGGSSEIQLPEECSMVMNENQCFSDEENEDYGPAYQDCNIDFVDKSKEEACSLTIYSKTANLEAVEHSPSSQTINISRFDSDMDYNNYNECILDFVTESDSTLQATYSKPQDQTANSEPITGHQAKYNSKMSCMKQFSDNTNCPKSCKEDSVLQNLLEEESVIFVVMNDS